MAELTEVFELAKLTISRNTTIQPIENERCTIVSSKENGFLKLDLDSRKATQSWAISKGQNLSAPAVFNCNLQEYFAVMNDKEWFSWNHEHYSLSVAKMELLQIGNPIVQMHLISEDGLQDVILLDKTGKSYLKSKLGDSTAKESNTEDTAAICKRRYLWSTTVDAERSNDMMLFTVTEESQTYKLSSLLIGKVTEGFGFQESHEFILEPMFKGSHILACTLQGRRLIVLWSDNSLCAYSVPLHQNESHQTMFNRTLIRKLPQEFKISGKGNPKPKIGTIDKGHIFLVAKVEVGEKKQGVVSILNTKYGTEQARTSFSLHYNPESSKEQEILSAIFQSGHVVVALSTSVIACSCTIVSSSLAAVMGKIKRSETVIQYADEKPIVASNKLKRNKKGDDGKHSIETEQMKCLEKLADASKTPTVEDFNRELNAFLKRLHLNVVPDEPHRKKKKKEKSKRKYLVPEVFVQTVIKRCKEDDSIWSTRVPVHLLELQCVPPSLCADLIAEATKKQSLDVLAKCFDCIDGINEKDIVKSIQYLLSTKATSEDWKKPNLLTGELVDDFVRINEEAFQILIQILNYSYNEYALQDMLRMLSIQETKELLQILFELLSRHKLGSCVPVSHDKVVDWLSMVINAQFTSILLAEDIPPLVKQIYQTVSYQMDTFRDFEALEPFLTYLKHTYKLPMIENAPGAYCVEKILI
ncbi:nucleolar protein 11-like [Rhopilema esculentum]|uniref:nucleolar protein 11-like n=1 Tax=Rhopilema esculentum TaxID=499914 RepID=UPI0031E48D5A